MSRIGKKPVAIPAGVKVNVAGSEVTVEGKLGKLSYEHRPEVEIAVEDDSKQVVVTRKDDNRESRAYHGLTRALLANMMVGVTEGYEKKLEIHGVGWTAAVAGSNLKLNVGYANTIEMPIPAGVSVSVEKQHITLESADKHALGQFAAAARSKGPPEPYNGKGIRYADEIIRKKEGKQFGK